MRRVAYSISALLMATWLMAGCGSNSASTAEDDAFQKQLADASATYKGSAKGPRGGGIKLPPELASKAQQAKPPANAGPKHLGT